MAGERWDTLDDPTAPHLHWSTDNLGEAAPGVLTPLGWSLWGTVGERASRQALHALGALSAAERAAPSDVHDRILRIFRGRVAMQVEFLATLGNRMPGTSGQDIVRGIFGRVPDDLDYTPTRARYPAVAARLPVVAATTPGAVRRLAAETDAWWRLESQRVAGADHAGTVAVLREAARRFERTLTLHTTALMAVVQPLYDAVGTLVARTGSGDVAALSGSGGAEMAVVTDIWRASRGEIALAVVVARHGFHGPLEGELSSRVWREDPSPLAALVERYATQPESAAPAALERRARRRAAEARAELLAALPAWQRPAAGAVLAMAARRIPLRGVGKRSFLQSFDVARAAARRLGDLLAADGLLDDPSDVFYLTVPELVGTLPGDAHELVRLRRARRREYQSITLPGHWTGTPTPLAAPEPVGGVDGADRDGRAGPAVVTGIGVSAGVVEGIARVLLTPDFDDAADGEILVAPTTDPSWSSVMFVSAALVVDIGSALSHAAVVARELALPCVVNTRTGTRDLRTGDRVRVDGTAGTIEILVRAAT